MLTLSHVGLWVHDQDEALAFYTERLGFEVRDDATLEDFGNFRWLTVGPPSQPEVAVILTVPGPPLYDPSAAKEITAFVAQGRGAGLILATDDCQARYEELRARGVVFEQEPDERFYGIDAAFRDPSGNQSRIVQPA